jgi:DNA-binding CsgD family transcriptional regulator
MVSTTLDASAVRAYVTEWMAQDPLFAYVGTRTLYTRSGLAEEVPAFAEAVQRAPIFHEFYHPLGVRDVAAILHDSTFYAQVAVFTDRFGDPLFRDRAQQVLPILEPAFLAGARALVAWVPYVASFARWVDEIPTATALYDLQGRTLHRNRALRALLARRPQRTIIEQGMDRTALELAALVRPLRQTDLRPVLRDTRGTVVRLAGVEISGTVALSGIGGTPPLLGITVSPTLSTRRPELAADADIAARLRLLSPREQEVAWLLADGRSARDIAVRLGVTVHTARRHTERVLKGLGVHRRSEIPGCLLPLRARMDD